MSHASIEALGWALVHFLWQGALVALVLEVVLMALRDRSSRDRYLVRCGALALMAALPVGTYLWLAGHPTPGRGMPLVMSAGLEELRAMRDSLGSDVQGASWTAWVVLAWAVGASAFAIRVLRDYVRVRRIQRIGAGSRLPADWQERFRHLALRMGVEAQARVIDSAALSAPTVIGWLRPIVLIPARALSGLSERELELVLAHELAHIRRHDYLVNLAQSAVEALLFYHPAVWWVSNGIRTEREFCCDDAALDVARDGVIYARALATLEGWRSAPVQLGLSTLGGPLMTRIQRLVGVRTSPRPVRAPLVALGVLVLVGGATAFTHGHAEPQDQETVEALRRQIDAMETQLDQLRALLDQASAEASAEPESAEDVRIVSGVTFTPHESEGEIEWGSFKGQAHNVFTEAHDPHENVVKGKVNIVVTGKDGQKHHVYELGEDSDHSDGNGKSFVYRIGGGDDDEGDANPFWSKVHEHADKLHEAHGVEKLHDHLRKLHGKHDKPVKVIEKLRSKDGFEFDFDFGDLHEHFGTGGDGDINIGDHAEVEIHIQTGDGEPQVLRKRVQLPKGKASHGIIVSKDGKRYEFKDNAKFWTHGDDEDVEVYSFKAPTKLKETFQGKVKGGTYKVLVEGLHDGHEADVEADPDFFILKDDDGNNGFFQLRTRLDNAKARKLPKLGLKSLGGSRVVIGGGEGKGPERIDLRVLPKLDLSLDGDRLIELNLSDISTKLQGLNLEGLEGLDLSGEVKLLMRGGDGESDVRVLQIGPRDGECEVIEEDCGTEVIFESDDGETEVIFEADSGEIV